MKKRSNFESLLISLLPLKSFFRCYYYIIIIPRSYLTLSRKIGREMYAFSYPKIPIYYILFNNMTYKEAFLSRYSFTIYIYIHTRGYDDSPERDLDRKEFVVDM